MKLLLVISSVVFLGIAPKAFGAASEELAAGKKVYTGKCARCHKLYEPTKYDDKTWDVWMTKMRQKAKLNDKQYQQLTAYLLSLRSPKS